MKKPHKDMEFFYSKDINVSKLMFFVYNYA